MKFNLFTREGGIIQLTYSTAFILWLIIVVLSYLFSAPGLDENDKEPFGQISRSVKKRVGYSLIIATFMLIGLFASDR